MRIEEELRYTIQLGQGDNPVLILRQPTAAEIKAFLNGRFIRRGNKVEDQSVTSRERFVDTLLIRVHNIEIKDEGGNYIPLTPAIAGWKERIPLNWKTSIAVKFEEQETLSEEDESFLGGPLTG